MFRSRAHQPPRRRRTGLLVAAVLALSACGGDGGDAGDADTGEAPKKGGTLTLLTVQEELDHLDPQRNYSGEDLAFASGYLHRTLTAYKFSPSGTESTKLVPDLATDIGTPNADATSWSWTLKDGVAFEDGSEITCADVKYGVSRSFATDVITDGPTYAISMLDIPKDKDGSSTYKGPYVAKGNDTAAFDKAVVCDGNKITFNLSRPVGDFNYTVTLLAFSPVPKASDTGEKYDSKPVSSGPYKISEYAKGTQLVLVRNENWDPASDDYRPAYPDRIVLKFGLEAAVIDQRLIADSGADKQALTEGDTVEPASLARVFKDERFADRRTNELDPFVNYIAINTKKLPNLEHRKAIAVALNRAELRTVAGGSFAGDLADGLVKPNMPQDYAPSGMWDGLLGQKVPETGDPEYAKQLIARSGQPMPTLVYDYNQLPANDKGAASLVGSLAKAGITVRPNPIETGQYFGVVMDPAKQGHLTLSGWGPDWSNASTVIPELFTPSGGFNLSQSDDPEFNKRVDAARAMTDRNAQAAQWKALNKEAMENVWAVPLRFRKDQRLAGSKVSTASGKGNAVYLWAPFGSWPYGELAVEQ